MKGLRANLLILVLYLFYNVVYADQLQVHNTSKAIQKTSINDMSEILHYLDNKLIDSGFPKQTRDYVLAISKKSLSNAHNFSLPEKKELINRNIYFLIQNLHIKNQLSSAIIIKQLDKANQSNKPWDYLLSTKQLDIFKSQSVFGSVASTEIQSAIVGICPIWPICENPTPKTPNKKKKRGFNNNVR